MQNVYMRRRNKLSTDGINRFIDKTLVTNPSSIFYFTGIKINPYERVFALIIDNHSEETHLLIPNLEKGIVKDQNIKEITYDDSEDPMNYLLNILLPAKTIGVDMEYLTLGASNNLLKPTGVEQSFVSCELVDISKSIQMLRLCKDSEEISKITIATDYTCAIFAELKKYIKVGHSEKDIALEIIRQMWSYIGVSSDGLVLQVLSGLNSSNPHGYSGDTRIGKGDPVTIDFGVNYLHYWSDMTRTFFVGKPTQKMADIYN